MKRFMILLFSVLISVALALFLVAEIKAFITEDYELNNIFPFRKNTLRNLNPIVNPYKNPEQPKTMEKTILIDSTITDGDKKGQDCYYIIVGSFKSMMQAQEKANSITNDIKLKIITLSPTPEGNYRISCGKYFTIEEAKANLVSIRKNINPEAWIYSGEE